MIMVGGISFIAAADDGRPASAHRKRGKIPGQSGTSRVISLIRSQAQTDDSRPLKEAYKGLGIFDAQHNVVFLIGGDILRHQIKAAQILLTFFELHYDNIGIRSGSDIGTALSDHAARGNPGEDTAVTVLVPGGNDGIRIFGTQSPVDILSAVFRTSPG